MPHPRNVLIHRPASEVEGVGVARTDDGSFARVFLNAVGDGGWADDVFGQFFLDATRAGVRQVVILAAGPDSRLASAPS